MSSGFTGLPSSRNLVFDIGPRDASFVLIKERCAQLERFDIDIES